MSLIRRGARVAAISAIHGNVQRRQQGRWAAADQAAADQAAAAQAAAALAPAPAAAPAPAPVAEASQSDMLATLKQLGELRDAGVLTEDEFAAQKARLLG